MRLNAQSDYALRLLMQLAVNENKLTTIAEVAQRFRISRNHLMKIAQALGHHGFIETVRGRAGEIFSVRMRGVDPDSVGTVTSLDEDLLRGGLDALRPTGEAGEDAAPAILIGHQLSRALGVDAG